MKTNNSSTDLAHSTTVNMVIRCLQHQRRLMECAHIREQQVHAVLHAYVQELKELDRALHNHSGDCSADLMDQFDNESGYRHLLVDIRQHQLEQVECERKLHRRCQQEVLAATKKMNSLNQLLTQLQSDWDEQEPGASPTQLVGQEPRGCARLQAHSRRL